MKLINTCTDIILVKPTCGVQLSERGQSQNGPKMADGLGMANGLRLENCPRVADSVGLANSHGQGNGHGLANGHRLANGLGLAINGDEAGLRRAGRPRLALRWRPHP